MVSECTCGLESLCEDQRKEIERLRELLREAKQVIYTSVPAAKYTTLDRFYDKLDKAINEGS